jgi:hypothetical protein
MNWEAWHLGRVSMEYWARLLPTITWVGAVGYMKGKATTGSQCLEETLIAVRSYF